MTSKSGSRTAAPAIEKPYVLYVYGTWPFCIHGLNFPFFGQVVRFALYYPNCYDFAFYTESYRVANLNFEPFPQL